jgi:hypothetical protein
MTTQIRPIGGGGWNTATLDSAKCVRKSQTFGVSLNSALIAQACRAMNVWVNCAGAGTASVRAQKVAKAAGLQLQEV